MAAKRVKVLMISAACILLVHGGATFFLKEGYALTSFGDILQTVLCVIAAAFAMRNAWTSHGPTRGFWALNALGFAVWAFAQYLWVHFEVILRADVPDPFIGDVVLFLHIVPFMAALVLRPDSSGEFDKPVLTTIDSFLLLLWWVYLYVFIVFPSQFVQPDLGQYSISFNALYVAEIMAWLSALAVFCLRAKGEWRKIYGQLLAAGTLYILASQSINAAILANNYHTGDIHDLFLAVSMMWFVGTVAWAGGLKTETSQSDIENVSSDTNLFASRLSVFAMLSLPLLATWCEYASDAPHRVVRFRLTVTLFAIVLLGALVFLKQHLLDRERARLYEQSRERYANLKRLQTQIVQSEKLVALGQLVAGAAHEINNPLTAILGYSDLLKCEPSADAIVRSHVDKIQQQARRTQDLVLNMLRFARQTSSDKALLDLNRLVEDTVQLRQLELTGKNIQFRRELQRGLPPLSGDQTQLVDVLFHLLGNAADALLETKGGTTTVRTRSENRWLVLEVIDDGPGMLDPKRVFDPFYTTKGVGRGTGLGLSVCYGIIKDHRGEIYAENNPGGGARFVVRLPIANEAFPHQAVSAAAAGE